MQLRKEYSRNPAGDCIEDELKEAHGKLQCLALPAPLSSGGPLSGVLVPEFSPRQVINALLGLGCRRPASPLT